MLDAVMADFARCPGVDVRTVPEGLPRAEEATAFRQLARSCEWTLVIAPESEGILFERCRRVEEEGGRLLGPNSAAVRLTGDKWELSRHLAQHEIPTPRCELLRSGVLPSFPLVCKPRDGAGSQATFLIHTAAELERCVAEARSEGWAGDLLLQPFIPGQAVSVSMLIGPRGQVACPAATQHLSADGRFHYLGGRVPLVLELDERARQLAGRAVACVAGLRGWVGVDLVLGETADSDAVIEINPRLTTSYVGLRALTETNLASVMLSLVMGGEAPVVTWRAGMW